MLAGWFFALSRIYLIKNDILSLRKELLENIKKEEDGGVLRRLAAGIEEGKVKINSLFLSESGLVRLIEGLESLGKNFGLNLKITSVFAGDDESKPRVSFSIEGTFNQIFQYLYHVDNFPYPLSIEKAFFQKIGAGKEGGKKEEGKWQVIFDVKLESYENS